MTLTRGELGWYVHVHESICGPFDSKLLAFFFYNIWRYQGWQEAMNFRTQIAQRRRQVTT